MMSKEKRRVPKLRFPGFTEDWEQRKLESLFTKYEDKVNTPSSGYWRLGLRSHCKGTFHTYIDAGNELEIAEMNRVKSGNFILNITFAWERALAVTNDEDQDKLVSHRFPQFKPNNDLVIDFFKHTLTDKRFKHHLELSSPGGAGRNKVLKVADMLKYELLVPSIKEQNEISSFLNHVDYIITLHQRKLDNLKLKKKALLQKLFPKNGERYPELRFPGFTDAWEQRKLGDFYTFKNGLNKEKVYFGYGDSIVNFTDVFHNRQIYSSTLKGKVFVNKKELENFKVKEGDLFFTRTSETIDEIGFPAVVMEPMEHVVFSGFVLRGRAEKNDPLVNIFKSYIFFTDNFRSEMKKKSSMTTRALTSGTALKEMYFSYPKDLEEQTKIGEILLRLDNVITLHQRKLDHLQLQKKALLQQMFV
jgi:type I restriction enzyme S subunit